MSLLCQLLFAGTVHCVQIKLHVVPFFPPLQIDELGSLMLMKQCLLFFGQYLDCELVKFHK